MTDSSSNSSPQDSLSVDLTNVLFIVTGAHLRAEMADRPLAYRLQDHIVNWMKNHAHQITETLDPIVCSDIWYINQKTMHRRPTISLGGPGVNSLSGYLTQKLTPALVQDGTKIIQLDPEFIDLRACVWGMNHDATVQAIDRFVEQYLDGFLKAILTQVEPHVD